ncbi:DgyrCDS3175 [Dimorphilus gyrociliatus]|uniref:DgyrCDS3175 n=1 Tax=Dimorphilus gyrociliatus TaxID=2664684 RepID=A0A7I8VFE3_9ANNE|nr:DgyrCDS3175 [Dimorphilus gyrociliatus]
MYVCVYTGIFPIKDTREFREVTGKTFSGTFIAKFQDVTINTCKHLCSNIAECKSFVRSPNYCTFFSDTEEESAKELVNGTGRSYFELDPDIDQAAILEFTYLMTEITLTFIP